jgi:hypothetical protein
LDNDRERYQYQQLTLQHGLEKDENSLHPKLDCIRIEGISASKSNYLSRLMREHEIEIVAILETHTTLDLNLLNRGKLHGFKLIGAIHSNVFG